jgi:hypothetical protein
VPPTEAPIRDLRSPRGWHVVVSSFLHQEDSTAALRVRFFRPDGKLAGTDEGPMMLDDTVIGRLFGGPDEIFAFVSSENRNFNSTTEIWLLPRQGEPRRLLDRNATLGKFSKNGNQNRAGVLLRRETYGGINGDTKGWIDEFWIWDPATKVLTRDQK